MQYLTFACFSAVVANTALSLANPAVKRQLQAPIGGFTYQDPDWNDQNGAHCYLTTVCKDHNNPGPGVCGPGETVVGWDAAGCGGQKGKAICCQSTTNINNCLWRGGTGGSSDCDGQCHVGEINVRSLGSSWGGWPAEPGADQKKCNRGFKSFCCNSEPFDQLTKGCYWTGCATPCPSDFDQVISASIGSGGCARGMDGPRYCCPRPNRFLNCYWNSGRDCTNNRCSGSQIEIALDTYGDSPTGCSWGRKEAACCDIPIQANCSVDLCEVYQGYCPDPDSDVEDEPSSITNDKRALKRGNFSYVFGDDDDPDLVEDQLRNLERRGSQQRKWINFIDVNGVAHVFSYIIAGWYSYNEIFNHQPWNPQDPNHLPEQVFQAENPNDCTDLTVKGFTFNTPLPPQNPAGHTEHVIDKGPYLRGLYQCWADGSLPSGGHVPSNQGPVNTNWLLSELNTPQPALDGQQIGLINNNVYPNGLPNVPVLRIAEAMGSTDNRGNFLVTEANLNMMKGRIMNGFDPAGRQNIRRALDSARQGSWQDFMTILSRVFEAFTYMASQDVRSRQRSILSTIGAEADLYELLGATNIQASTKAFNTDFFNHVAAQTQNWVRGVIRQARDVINPDSTRRTQAEVAASNLLDFYEMRINNIINFDGL